MWSETDVCVLPLVLQSSGECCLLTFVSPTESASRPGDWTWCPVNDSTDEAREIWLGVLDSHTRFLRTWVWEELGPFSEAWGWGVDFMTPLEVHHVLELCRAAVTSCGILVCVLKSLAQRSLRSHLSSLMDLELSARALEMIKRERGKNKQNQNRKMKPLPSSRSAGSRPQATFFPWIHEVQLISRYAE